MRKVIFTTKTSSLNIFLIHIVQIAPKISPSTRPPKVKLQKRLIIAPTPAVPPFIIAYKNEYFYEDLNKTEEIWNKIIQVPSLIKDSPSIKELNFLDAPAS